MKAQERAVMMLRLSHRASDIMPVNSVLMRAARMHRFLGRDAEQEQGGEPQGKNGMKYPADHDLMKLPKIMAAAV